MKKTILALSLGLLAFGSIACDEEEDRYEHLKKLRAFGVASNPVIATPSTAAAPQVMTLTFHAAVPLGEEITAEPFVDEQARFAQTVELTLVPGSETYTDYAAFRLYSVQATAPVPTADLVVIPPEPGFLRVRYGLKLTSGSEEEKIVGNFLLYPAGAPEASWTAPTVDIITPAAGTPASGDDQELKAEITNPIGEDMRVGWFVSDGNVKNRRAKDTEWETPDAGPHTILVTIRGTKSGSFAFKAMDVTVE